METSKKSTTDEIREALEARRASALQQFRRDLARLDRDTRECLSQEPEDMEAVYKGAARRYVQLLADFHGIDWLRHDLGFMIRRQWHGSPIVDVLGNASRTVDYWDLRTQVWIHPDGMCWEARKVGSIHEERLDEKKRVLYFQRTEPYVVPQKGLWELIQQLFAGSKLASQRKAETVNRP